MATTLSTRGSSVFQRNASAAPYDSPIAATRRADVRKVRGEIREEIFGEREFHRGPGREPGGIGVGRLRHPAGEEAAAARRAQDQEEQRRPCTEFWSH